LGFSSNRNGIDNSTGTADIARARKKGGLNVLYGLTSDRSGDKDRAKKRWFKIREAGEAEELRFFDLTWEGRYGNRQRIRYGCDLVVLHPC
jgi:hypothetical protein